MYRKWHKNAIFRGSADWNGVFPMERSAKQTPEGKRKEYFCLLSSAGELPAGVWFSVIFRKNIQEEKQ